MRILKEASGTVKFDEKLTEISQKKAEMEKKIEAGDKVIEQIKEKLEGLQVDKETSAKIEFFYAPFVPVTIFTNFMQINPSRVAIQETISSYPWNQ